MIALQIILCILIADFITGLAHWFEDSYSLPSWPVLGRLVAEPNIEHHRWPRAMVVFGSVLTRNFMQVVAASAICLIVWLLDCLTWQVALVAGLTALGNEVHAWAHGAGFWGTDMLQEMGLVLQPSHHAKHHKAPFTVRYCTLTNLCNPVLDRLHFWACLEWVISVAGIEPKRLTEARRFV